MLPSSGDWGGGVNGEARGGYNGEASMNCAASVITTTTSVINIVM